MKKAIVMMLILLPMLVWGQDRNSLIGVAFLESVLTDSTQNNILVKRYGNHQLLISPNDKKADVLLLTNANDADYNTGIIVIYHKQLSEFRAQLMQLKAKSCTWNEIANSNGVNSLYKKIPVKFPKILFGWAKRGQLYGRKGVSLEFYYSIENDKKAIVLSDVVTSARNKYVSSRYNLHLSQADLNELIKLISEDSIQSILNHFKNEKLQKEKLFQ